MRETKTTFSGTRNNFTGMPPIKPKNNKHLTNTEEAIEIIPNEVIFKDIELN